MTVLLTQVMTHVIPRCRRRKALAGPLRPFRHPAGCGGRSDRRSAVAGAVHSWLADGETFHVPDNRGVTAGGASPKGSVREASFSGSGALAAYSSLGLMTRTYVTFLPPGRRLRGEPDPRHADQPGRRPAHDVTMLASPGR